MTAKHAHRHDRRADRALRRAAAGLALALAAAAGAPAEVQAQALAQAQERARDPDPFSALVGKRRDRADKESGVERYVVSADGRVFLFEMRDSAARIKFLCHDNDPRLDCRIDPDGPVEEIYALIGTRGPRGDMIFKDLEGEQRLRLGSYGGATVFWPGDPLGQAASKSFGDDAALGLEPAGPGTAHRRAQSAAAHLSALTGAPMMFDVDLRARAPQLMADAAAAEAAAESAETGAARNAAVLADAVARVAAGMMRVAGDPTGARILGVRVTAVRFVEGAAPSLSLDGSILTVAYDPTGDIEGRPSSAAVGRFLEESL